MQNNLTIVKLNDQYCNYLRNYDNKVPYNFNDKSNRPFVGILFQINNCSYYAPLSSPKNKHKKMKNKLDFYKLDNGNLGAINFNNMIPVKNCNIIELDLNLVPTKSADKRYYKLLNSQIYWINRNKSKIINRSEKLYNLFVSDELSLNIKKRCCDFILLEEKCNEYNNIS